jgi:hypothetical protein
MALSKWETETQRRSHHYLMFRGFVPLIALLITTSPSVAGSTFEQIFVDKTDRYLAKQVGCFDATESGLERTLIRNLTTAFFEDPNVFAVMLTTAPYSQNCSSLLGSEFLDHEVKFGTPEVVATRSVSESEFQDAIVVDGFSSPVSSILVTMNYKR